MRNILNWIKNKVFPENPYLQQVATAAARLDDAMIELNDFIMRETLSDSELEGIARIIDDATSAILGAAIVIATAEYMEGNIAAHETISESRR